MHHSADTLEGAFAEFLDRLRPSAEELEAARNAAARAAGALRLHFRPVATVVAREDHLVGGSFGKRTVIRPLPRLDLFYLLPPESSVGGPPACGAALREVAVALSNAFDRLDVESWRILIEGVAVVPCIEHSGAFLIPGPTGWRVSNPAAETAALRLADSLSGGSLVRLLALLKTWRLQVDAPISAFALEILAREFISTAQTGPIAALVTEFLAWGRRHTPGRFDLPGGAEYLDPGSDWHGPAEAAYWRCVLAQRHIAAGETEEALQLWRKLLGPEFAARIKVEDEDDR